VIDDSGKSTNVAAEGDIEDPEMSACLVRAHQRIRFPAVRHGGIVRVTYPYMFKPPRRHADGLSVTDEADILLHYVESGTQSQAIAALAEIEAELVGRPPRDLLPYLSHARVRAEFDAKFRRAALDRLDQPNPLPALWAAVAVSVASRAPEDLEDVIGQRAVDIESATAILHDLIEGGHLDAAQRVARAWHNGPMTTGELYRVFAGDGYVRAAMPARWFFVLIRAIDHGDEDAGQLDDLIAVARELGLDRVVGDRILRRCDVATAPCTRWLRADLDDPRLRARLESIHNRRIAVLERGRDSEDEIAELANLLEQLGRAGQARRIRSELSDRTSGQR
jgi:hypothetical protein